MRILIADDDGISRRMLRGTLEKWGHEVLEAQDGNEASALLRDGLRPPVVILDWSMPGKDGPEICREIRAAGGPYSYLILLTARTETQDVIDGFESGADDYLTKPLNTGELRARLRAGLRILDLQSDLLRAQEELRRQASHDSLTGLWNRPAILDRVREELARAQRGGWPLGLILADLDRFKRVNDTYGHLAGDRVLRETALRLEATLRPGSAVGRYGGEELLIVCPECDLSQAGTVAERLRRSLHRAPFTLADGEIQVTASFGVAASADGEDSVENLLAAADTALYSAKARGRNQVALGRPLKAHSLALAE
jgi:two-component system cell cycle response regulator